MRSLARLRSLWRNVAHRGRAEAELDDELRAYIDLLTAEYERAGMSPDQARRAALLDTGGIDQVKEATRDIWVGNALATTGRELRYVLRTLRRSPAFLIISIAALAIGIGGATAVFTVVNASLLRPLPGVADPDRLITVERVQTSPTRRQIAELSYPDYLDLRDQSRTLVGLAGFNGTSMAMEDAAGTTRVWVSYVSDDFFTVLGVRPSAGRFFGSAELSAGAPGAHQVAVLGHALWQSRWAGSPDAIGATIQLEGHAYTIIGVAPPGFIGAMSTHRMEVWIPVGIGSRPAPVLSAGGLDLTSRRDDPLRLVGRLAPGSSVDDAQRELAAIADRLAAEHATNRGRTVQVFEGTGMTADERRQISRVPRLLAMAVALLLLIACSNVAGLSLVRAAARRRELATRLALGASRTVLVRQVVLEGTVIAIGAGVLGILLSRSLVRSATLVRTVVPMEMDPAIDARVLAIAIIASTMTALLVSLLPAMQILQVPPNAVLKDGGGTVRRRAGQRALVAAQVGASVVLLSAAAMVYASFQRVLGSHDVFDPDGLTDIGLERGSLPDPTAERAFYRAVLARAQADPEISEVALTSTIPPFQWSAVVSVFRNGEEPSREILVGREAELGLRVQIARISADFFSVMRIPVVRGRAFAAGDDERAAPVAIVSRQVAEDLWPGRDPVGQVLAWPSVEGPPRRPLRVVGVVADTRGLSPSAPPSRIMYLPYAQHDAGAHILIARGRGNGPMPAGTLRRIITEVNPDGAASSGRTLSARLEDEMLPQRRASVWIGVFGAIALLLAAIGLYGIVAQAVLQRTREIAVRSALGASPGRILASVLGDGMRLVAFGAVAGAVSSIAAFQIVRSLFADVQAADAPSTAVAAALLLVAMAIAAYLPARRATKLDPSVALRCD